MLRGSNNIITWVILAITAAAAGLVSLIEGPWWVAVAVVGLLISASPRIVNEWERGVLLRLGRFRKVLSRGITWIIPGIDNVVRLVDTRIRSTSFMAEDALTQDTVPVSVDAVLFWVVTDPERAVLEVADFSPTVSWAAQTTLRDVIGRTELVRMISDRESLDVELQETIDRKTSEWGITVQSVEIRDVKLPKTLEDAMSRKAQADRERESRIILADSERQVADRMRLAAKIYEEDPIALRLRAMNITYESIKESGALMVIPSGMADAINPGVIGMAAAGFGNSFATQPERDAASGEEKVEDLDRLNAMVTGSL